MECHIPTPFSMKNSLFPNQAHAEICEQSQWMNPSWWVYDSLCGWWLYQQFRIVEVLVFCCCTGMEPHEGSCDHEEASRRMFKDFCNWLAFMTAVFVQFLPLCALFPDLWGGRGTKNISRVLNPYYVRRQSLDCTQPVYNTRLQCTGWRTLVVTMPWIWLLRVDQDSFQIEERQKTTSNDGEFR